VCDQGNAKVKTFSEQFIEELMHNGVKVYTERLPTHQPGYQVRAASLNSNADFFFQIHSKTAGPGHVRLYVDGQPKRMTRDEAIAEVWSLWRLKCGALTREEVDLLSAERLLGVLKDVGNVDPPALNIGKIQSDVVRAFENDEDPSQFLDRLRECETLLLDGKTRITAMRVMGTDWHFEPGAQITRCLPMALSAGLSLPLRDALLLIIDETLQKVRSLTGIVARQLETSPHLRTVEEPEIEIPNEEGWRTDGSTWRMLIESDPVDHIGSYRIASYGDTGTAGESLGRMPQPLLLDDY
jgi:hypothetical protein